MKESKTIKFSLKKIMRYLSDMYGPDNVTFKPFHESCSKTKSALQSRGVGEIRILYPKVKIENEQGESRVISNLLIIIGVEAAYTQDHGPYGEIVNEYILKLIGGTRLSFDKEDFVKGYVHSHMSTSSAMFSGLEHYDKPSDIEREVISRLGIRGFCLGDGEPRHYLGGTRILDMQSLVLFFTVLDAFLSWESLEGGPYRYIAHFGNESLKPLFETGGSDLRLALASILNAHISQRLTLGCNADGQLIVKSATSEVVDEINEGYRSDTDYEFEADEDESIREDLCFHLIVDELEDGTIRIYNSYKEFKPLNPNPEANQASLFEEDSREDYTTVPNPIDESKRIYLINKRPLNSSLYEEERKSFKIHPDLQRIWKQKADSVRKRKAFEKRIESYQDERKANPQASNPTPVNDQVYLY